MAQNLQKDIKADTHTRTTYMKRIRNAQETGNAP